MSRITQKLKSQSGASLIISLIFFLTAFMVGTVVLSAATANSDKLIARREERQRYFTLSSAARFLRTTIEGTKGEAWAEKTLYLCDTSLDNIIDPRHIDTDYYYSGDTTKDMDVTKTDNKIQILLTKTAYEMYEKLRTDPNASIEKEFTIEVPDMEPVDVTLTMNNDYNLLLELKVQGSGETMAITVPNAAPKEPTESTGMAVPPICKHLCGDKLDTDGDGIVEDVEVEKEFNITTKRWTTEVSWLTATISKGVAAP